MHWNNFIQKPNTDYLKWKGKLILYSFYLYSKARPIIFIIAKRSIEDTFNEDSSSEFKYDDSENQPSKKNKGYLIKSKK